jgi:squalene cyclase
VIAPSPGLTTWLCTWRDTPPCSDRKDCYIYVPWFILLLLKNICQRDEYFVWTSFSLLV